MHSLFSKQFIHRCEPTTQTLLPYSSIEKRHTKATMPDTIVTAICHPTLQVGQSKPVHVITHNRPESPPMIFAVIVHSSDLIITLQPNKTT